jgi:tRNA-splicing ligase RtcB
MTLRDSVQKLSDNHFVLPKAGDMKTEVHAFLSQDLFDSCEDAVWDQASATASYPGIIGAYLMPDTHSGFGCPIGSVFVTEDTLIQCVNGFDISCGILHMKVPGLKARAVQSKEKRRRFIDEAEKRVATGIGSNRPELMPKYTETQSEEILRFGAKALNVDAGLCERQYIPIPDDIDLKKIERARATVISQLGSVGSGNHFIELQCDPVDGQVWVMIHCGSRGYGHKTADYFFHEGAKLRGLDDKRREESWLRMDEPLGQEYWNYMSSCANFAVANRHIIVEGVNDALEAVWNVRGEVYYEISHNLVQQETLVLPDGTTKKGFVHRKGATRAFPAGHPDLKDTIWEDTGHPTLVPGDMVSGAAILFPQANAYDSACSINHGSGRILGRKEAGRRLKSKQSDINDEMQNIKRTFNGVEIESIVGNWRNVPIDECQHVYKNLDEVLAVIENANIAKVVHRLFPIANMKGTD